MTEKFKNHESFTENEALKEMLKKISYNLEHTKPKYLKREFDNIEGNKEAYEILIKGIKDLIINDGKLDKNDFSTVIFIQIIGKIKGKFEGKRDGKWSPEIDKLIPQIFSSNELNNIKIIECIKPTKKEQNNLHKPQTNEKNQTQKSNLNKTKPKETANTNETKEKQELTPTQTKELIQKGNKELQKINENINKQNQKINSKIISLTLILDIAGMYKEYLQSILSNIKFNITSKNTRYENQITTIEGEIKNINNIIEYINLIHNTSDLLSINNKDLLNRLIVSEEKISGLGNLDQPFTFDKTKTVKGVNKGYEDIKNILGNPNITIKDIEKIRLNIFDKIRSYDGVDDDKHRYNTSEAIVSRITGNVLDNKDLNNDNYVKNSFDLIKNLGKNKKTEFYQALNGGKEVLKNFLKNINLFNTLGIKDDKQKDKLLKNIYNTLKEGKDNIDDNKLNELIKKEIQNKIDYLKSQKLKNQNKENNNNEINKKIDEKIKELEDIKNNNNDLNKQLEEVKIQTIYKTFERMMINEVLNKKQDLVNNLSKQNTDIKLYSDIEGIGSFKMSDKRFNSLSTGTQFIAEQIIVMGISGGVGSLAVKGVGGALRLGETASLFKGGINLANIGKLGLNTVIDGGAFYLTYTGLEGIINEREINSIKKIYSKLDTYDAIRTILFLGILRGLAGSLNILKNSSETKFISIQNLKNITFDTSAILGVDLSIRGLSGWLTGKEGIKGVDLKNIKETDIKKIGELLVEELSYIVPLIIGLKMSDKVVSNMFKNKNCKVEVSQTETEVILEIKGKDVSGTDIKKEIRILKQKRNILRNKGKKVKYIKEINNELKEKKAEYKEIRDSNSNINNVTKIIPKVQNTTNQSTKDDKKTEARDNVNMLTGESTKYEKLKEYSEQAQKGKIDYALNDKDIGKTLTDKGIGTEGKSVGEGLLKKSGFDGDEIKDYNEGRLKSEKTKNPTEKNALREMEKAIDIINKQFINIKADFIEYKKDKSKGLIFLKNLKEKYGIQSNIAKERLINLLIIN